MLNPPAYYAQRAESLFRSGYNCSQSVFLAFEDLYSMDHEEALRLSSPFGGGMGRLREVCGTVTGMFLVLGMLYGYSDVTDPEAKQTLYTRVQALAKRFEAETGSIVCREILGIDKKHDAPIPEARTDAYYQKRPCPKLCALSARILAEYMEENPFPKTDKEPDV